MVPTLFGGFDVIMMTAPANSATEGNMHSRGLKIYFDGGCRPNPGTMETAVVARGITYHQPDCGIGTNNDAEWLALIHAAEIALSIGIRDAVMIGDSALVVGQASLRAKCRSPELQAHLARFQALAGEFERIKIRKTPRSQNLAGIALAKTRL
jgi:ribonuclease HI